MCVLSCTAKYGGIECHPEFDPATQSVSYRIDRKDTWTAIRILIRIE